MNGISFIGSAAPLPINDSERLRQAVQDLEGVFVQQLFKAMRETVPQEGVVSGGSGEEMFTGMLDQHLSGAAPEQWARSLGDSLYSQLKPMVMPPATTGEG